MRWKLQPNFGHIYYRNPSWKTSFCAVKSVVYLFSSITLKNIFSVLLILTLAWADLGPLQYLKWRSSWLKSRVEIYYYCSKEFHLMYGRGPSSASEKHRQIKIETVSPFSSVWVPLILFCFIILWQLFKFSMLLSWLYFHKKKFSLNLTSPLNWWKIVSK